MVVDLHKQVLAGQNPLHKDSKHRQGKALVFPCLSYCHRMAYRRCQYHPSAPMPANAFAKDGPCLLSRGTPLPGEAYGHRNSALGTAYLVQGPSPIPESLSYGG